MDILYKSDLLKRDLPNGKEKSRPLSLPYARSQLRIQQQDNVINFYDGMAFSTTINRIFQLLHFLNYSLI